MPQRTTSALERRQPETQPSPPSVPSLKWEELESRRTPQVRQCTERIATKGGNLTQRAKEGGAESVQENVEEKVTVDSCAPTSKS